MTSVNQNFEFKLFIDKTSQKVLFAEVGKDVVDFLLSLFALPMGSVVNLITKDSTIGSLGSMYSSWEHLDDKFLQSTKMNANLLIPAISYTAPTLVRRIVGDDTSSGSFADVYNRMIERIWYVEPNGYVKSGLNYAVMDDLSIVPLTASVDSIQLLKKLGLKDLSLLEHRIVNLNFRNEGLGFLKTLLCSKNVLTDKFLARAMASQNKSHDQL